MLNDFSTLFEFCPIGAYRSSPDGVQLRANPALVHLNGYTSEAEMLDSVKDIGSEWYVDPARRNEFKALLERDGYVKEFVSEVHRHKTRERIWVREHAHVVRDREGLIRFYEGTVEEVTRDVLAQQALRHSEEQLRTITAQIPGLVYRLHIAPDGRRRFNFVSSGVRDIFGIDPEAVMADGELLRSYTHPDDRAMMSAVTRQAREAGVPVTIEFRAIPPAGERWVQLTSSTVPSAEPGITRIGVIVDITERKQSEGLRIERDRAETANRMTTQFLSRVSHELRTPLNAILGFAQLMELGTPTPAQQARWVQEILASGHHLLGLVDDVLDLSSVQSGQQRLDLQPVDLGMVVDAAWSMLATQAAAAEVQFRHALAQAPVLWVQADARRLRQVLGNLLSNAVKYNRLGGVVSLTAYTVNDRVVFEVADTGQGMTSEQLLRLFNAFDRLGAQHTGVPGTGLGLILSKQLVEAMGGDIVCRSEPGQGSVFTVTLPAAEPPVLSDART